MFLPATKIKKRVIKLLIITLMHWNLFLKTQKVRDKAVNTYSSTIRFLPECFMTQEMCNKAVNR